MGGFALHVALCSLFSILLFTHSMEPTASTPTPTSLQSHNQIRNTFKERERGTRQSNGGKKSEIVCSRGVFSNFESLRRGGRGVTGAKGPGQSKGVGGLIPDGLQSNKVLFGTPNRLKQLKSLTRMKDFFHDQLPVPTSLYLRPPAPHPHLTATFAAIFSRCRMSADWSPLPISDFAIRSKNPLRAYVETMRPPQDDPRPLIPLSLGDPTVYGNFQCPPQFDEAIAAALACVHSRAHNRPRCPPA